MGSAVGVGLGETLSYNRNSLFKAYLCPLWKGRGSRIDKPVVTFKLWEEVTARGTTWPAHHAEGLVLLLGKWLLPLPCPLME